MIFLKKFSPVIFCLFTLFQAFSQTNYQAPTLSAGLDNITFKPGTLNVELLTKIIAEKQKELVREGIKRTIYKSIGNSEKLDDLTQFYIERIVDIVFNEKNHQVITKRVLEETTNYLFILGTTKYILESKNEAVKYLFTDEERFLNLDKDLNSADSISITKNEIFEKLEKIKKHTVKNAIIKTILTICKEIPIIKELGLLNDFNYLELDEVYNSTLFENQNNLVELINLEQYFDFTKIDSVSLNNFDGKITYFLKDSYQDKIPEYLSQKINVKKCISILRVYKTIKELIANSNILKDITSKTGIRFSSIEQDLTEVIKNYEKLNVYSFNDNQLIFTSNNTESKINVNTLISYYKTLHTEINNVNSRMNSFTEVINKVKALSYTAIYDNKDINYNILSIALENLSKNELIEASKKIINKTQRDFIRSKVDGIIDKPSLDSIISKHKIDLTNLEKIVKNLKEYKNYFYVENILTDIEKIEALTGTLLKVKNHQTYLSNYSEFKNNIITNELNSTLSSIQYKYNQIRKLYKLSEGLLYSYNYLIDDSNNELKLYLDNLYKEQKKNQYLIDLVERFSVYRNKTVGKQSNILKFINSIKEEITNSQVSDFKTTLQLNTNQNKTFLNIENALIQIGNKINLGDFYERNTYDLFLEIKKTLNTFSYQLKNNAEITSEESKLLKDLYVIFSDRSLESKVDNLNILQSLNNDFLAKLRVLSYKFNQSGDTSLVKIINSINFSNTKLLIEKTKENQRFLSPKGIKNVLSFLKFIGNIKEFNKAETFTFLLKTMDDYNHLLDFDKENLKIIPDLINALRTYSIIDYDKNLIEIDVASVLIHLLEKYQEKSDVIFYATVGVNQFFIPSFDKNNPQNTNYSFGSFNAASEKIGAKWKIVDWNNRYFKENELIHDIRRKAYVSDYYMMAYFSGILYKIADTSGTNFNSAQFGVATGFTFFNSLDFNVSVSVPFDSQPFNNYILGFSFDIPLSEYLKRL